MENKIVGSTFKFAGSHLVNGVSIDFNSMLLLLIFIALLLVAGAIFAFVKYKRDKENIPNSTTVDYLNKTVKYHSADFDTVNQRLSILEAKQEGIDALHKSILELKSMIQKGDGNG